MSQKGILMKKLPCAAFTAAFVLLFSQSVLAGRFQPEECPCYQDMIDLTADAECTSYFDYFESGRGRKNISRQLVWQEFLPEGDPNAICTRLNVKASRDFGNRIDVFVGAPEGNTCLPDESITTERCGTNPELELTSREIDACNRILKESKRTVQRLPDC